MKARIGDRVRLIKLNDPYADLPPGSEGTVMHVDALGTIHVTWDCGSTLGLIPDEDRWTTLPQPGETPGAQTL